jgi:hypothetical protein
MSLSQYQLQYQICPIILTGGVANSSAGAMLPFIFLTNPEAFDPDSEFQLTDAFAIFQPAVGGSLVQQTIAQYPFANLSVAANAIIRDPIQISLIMMTPMKQESAWSVKLATISALKATLDAHNNAGGTYTVMTPGYIYDNMLMLDLVDVSMAQSPLPQNAWRWDFTRPLITQAQTEAAMSNLMNQLTNGTSSGNGLADAPSGSADETGSPAVSAGNAPIDPYDSVSSNPSSAIGQPSSIANTGPDAGAASPLISQMPLTTSPVGNAYPTYTPGNIVPGGGTLNFPASS